MMSLQINQISKKYDNQPILKDVSLTIETGEIVCLLGPSGCGKTTLLRLIAGLEKPDTGQILFQEQDVTEIPPHQRGFGLMFQEFALFPHKNVEKNIAFGLQMQHSNAKLINDKVKQMLDLVDLSGFEERDISSLSGGEKQRVALARSLAPDPCLLMLDEPLGALDLALRERLMSEIRIILKRVGLTTIYVTHDQMEAFAIADRIVVINQGTIEQDATPEMLYQHPATPFVARFLGFTNLVEAIYRGDGLLETKFGMWQIPLHNQHNLSIDSKLIVLVRPEAARVERESKSYILYDGKIVNSLFRGRFYQVTIMSNDSYLTFELSLLTSPKHGQNIKVWLNPADIVFYW
jgi:ABC-type Fe3+/spermidine/putrescine transport system ATPase subunit